MICARNFFKLFGSRVVIGGKRIVDDYYEQAAIAAGQTPDEPAIVEIYDPEVDTGTLAIAKRPEHRRTKTGFGGDAPRTRTYNKSSAKTILASLPPSTGGPRDSRYGGSGAPPFRIWDNKSRRPGPGLDHENWVHMYARAVGQANREIQGWREGHPTAVGINDSVADQLAAMEADDVAREAEEAANEEAPKRRRARSPTRAVFDAHSNVPHVRLELQPTRARIEQVAASPAIPGANGRAAARAGFATVVIEAEVLTAEEEARWDVGPWVVPGQWDFRTGML